MRKKEKENRRSQEEEEYVKSAAWAWYLHRSEASCKFIEESDAYATVKARSRGGGGRRGAGPSRFQLEAMGLLDNNNSPLQQDKHSAVLRRGRSLDSLIFDAGFGNIFREYKDDLMIESHESSSLLDPYEIETLSRQLHTATLLGAISSSTENSKSNSIIYSKKSWSDKLEHFLLKKPGSNSERSSHNMTSQLQEGSKYCSSKEVPIWKISVAKLRKLKKWWMISEISHADVLQSSYKINEGSNSSRVRTPSTHIIKSRQVRTMCSLTDVVVPGSVTPTRSPHHITTKVQSPSRLHSLAHKLHHMF